MLGVSCTVDALAARLEHCSAVRNGILHRRPFSFRRCRDAYDGVHAVRPFVAAFVFTVCVVVRMYWWLRATSTHAQPIHSDNQGENRQYGMYGYVLRFCRRTCRTPGAHGLAGLSYFFCSAFTSLRSYRICDVQGSHGGGILWTLMGGWSLSS